MNTGTILGAREGVALKVSSRVLHLGVFILYRPQ